MKVDVNIPIVERFPDYHEIPSFAQILNSVFIDKKVKYKEIYCAQSSYYYAIFYFKQDKKYFDLIKKYQKQGDEE